MERKELSDNEVNILKQIIDSSGDCGGIECGDCPINKYNNCKSNALSLKLAIEELGIIKNKTESDNVNHPSHYKQVPDIECIDVTRHFNFNRGNAIKYIWRAGEKDKSKEIEDLKKAIWYLNDEIKRIENA